MAQVAIAKEQRLNRLYSDAYTEEQAVEELIYLTNSSRGSHVSETYLRKAYREGRLGTVLKKYDPIAFNCAD